MSLDLERLGWNESLAAALAALPAAELVPGRVSLEHTHIYRVITEADEVLARVSGRLRHLAGDRTDFPAVGDWVAFARPTQGGDARIRAILPRRIRFSRRAAGDPTEEQIVAANIDTVFIVAGLDRDFNARRLERYLTVAKDSGARPVVVLNKADLVESTDVAVSTVTDLSPGTPVHAVSCRHAGTLDVLRQYLGFGQTGALLGSSGVGKSTIVNRLVGYDLLATREVRESDSRGRHTSTARQLVLLPGTGVLIDTPGMRELQLWDATELAGVFTDIQALASECRFRDCRHRQEPQCAVADAVADGRLSPLRLASYHKLQDEQAHQARQVDERAQLEARRRARVVTKALSKRIKEKD